MFLLESTDTGHDRVDPEPLDVSGIGAGEHGVGKGQQGGTEVVADPVGHRGLAGQRFLPQVGQDAHLGRPGDERRPDDLERLLGDEVEAAVQADVADKFPQGRLLDLPAQAGQPDQDPAFQAVVEKTVRPGLGQEPFLAVAGDGAAGPVLLFQDQEADIGPLVAEKAGHAQAGDAGADDKNIKRWWCHGKNQYGWTRVVPSSLDGL